MMSACCSIANRKGEGKDFTAVTMITSHGKAGDVVAVKGGESFVGTNDAIIASDGEGPARKVNVGDFYLEKETVTNRRFADFVEATGRSEERRAWKECVSTGRTRGAP